MAQALDAFGRPLRDLRISVTDRCNFRCTYCMPKEVFGHDYRFLDRKELLDFDEITRSGNYNVIGDYFDIKNKTLEYGFFLPIRNWTAGTATVIGPVSANSVFGSTVIGVYVGAGLTNGYITTIE